MASCSVEVEDVVTSVPPGKTKESHESLPDATRALLAAAEAAFGRTLSRDAAAFVARSRQASGEWAVRREGMWRHVRYVGIVGIIACAASSCGDGPPTAPTRSAVAIEFAALSRGLPADPSRCGGAEFRRNAETFYSGRGCAIGGARGWNVAALDPRTGALLESVWNFDTWYDGASAAAAMVEFLNRQPVGTLLLIAVGDEAGMTVGRTSGCPYNPAPGSTCCRPLGGEFERLRATLEGLGAREAGRLCYWNSYAVIITKGAGAHSEQLAQGTEALTRYTLPVSRGSSR
jgi:hypothetical protein